MVLTQIIKDTHKILEELSRRIGTAVMQSGMKEGRLHHELAYGLQMPLMSAEGYFRTLPEELAKAEKRFSLYEAITSPLQTLGAYVGRSRTATIREAATPEKIEKVYALAKEAAGQDLESSVADFGSMLSTRRGEKLSDEEMAKLGPVLKVMECLRTFYEMVPKTQ